MSKEIMDKAKKDYRESVSRIFMNQARIRINNTLLRIIQRESEFNKNSDK